MDKLFLDKSNSDKCKLLLKEMNENFYNNNINCT